MKTCSVCKVDKPSDQFFQRKASRDGLTAMCKSCQQNARPSRVGKSRKENLQRRYGITEQQYEAMKEAQSGACAMCGTTPTGDGQSGILYVDHNHATGRVRALLCHRCNTRLGVYESMLSVAPGYLAKYDA